MSRNVFATIFLMIWSLNVLSSNQKLLTDYSNYITAVESDMIDVEPTRTFKDKYSDRSLKVYDIIHDGKEEIKIEQCIADQCELVEFNYSTSRGGFFDTFFGTGSSFSFNLTNQSKSVLYTVNTMANHKFRSGIVSTAYYTANLSILGIITYLLAGPSGAYLPALLVGALSTFGLHELSHYLFLPQKNNMLTELKYTFSEDFELLDSKEKVIIWKNFDKKLEELGKIYDLMPEYLEARIDFQMNQK